MTKLTRTRRRDRPAGPACFPAATWSRLPPDSQELLHLYPDHLAPAVWERTAPQPAVARRSRRYLVLHVCSIPRATIATQPACVGHGDQMMTGKGRFQLQYAGELLTGEATACRATISEHREHVGPERGIYGLEYQMSSPLQGAGTCNLQRCSLQGAHRQLGPSDAHCAKPTLYAFWPAAAHAPRLPSASASRRTRSPGHGNVPEAGRTLRCGSVYARGGAAGGSAGRRAVPLRGGKARILATQSDGVTETSMEIAPAGGSRVANWLSGALAGNSGSVRVSPCGSG